MWRRQRLLQIGQEPPEHDAEETAPLRPDPARTTSYGTLPNSARTRKVKSKLNLRRGISSLQGITIPKSSISTPGTPVATTPLSIREHLSYLRDRPITAYDRANFKDSQEPGVEEGDVKTNGIRVWYSSFTSIDWLHDAIKDSARQARLRRRKSVRGKFRRQVDRSVGWLIVSIVGFLTAVVAFLIVRSEQWLFDLKEGICNDGWHKSKRFCCPVQDDVRIKTPLFLSMPPTESCPEWRTWSDLFAPAMSHTPFPKELIEYVAYLFVAVSTMYRMASLHVMTPCTACSSCHFVSVNHQADRLHLLHHEEGVGRVEPQLRKRRQDHRTSGNRPKAQSIVLRAYLVNSTCGNEMLRYTFPL